MRIWLHEWEGNASGWNAWSLDRLGCSTWARSRGEVLDRAPGKLQEHQQWLTESGWGEPAEESPSEIQIMEEIRGDEPAFQHDLAPATVGEIDRCIRMLGYTRRDLLQTVEQLPEEYLDWDPPYQHFDSTAWWKTIRQILSHVALCEIGYYLRNIELRADRDPEAMKTWDWREQLLSSRSETLRLLEELKSSPGDARITVSEVHGTWSIRKVLRRLVWHERIHGKSIARIVGEYRRG